jgi:small subunit ribosomal protein S17
MADAAVMTNSNRQRGKRDRRVGVVSSDKGDKTITVRCDFMVKHPKYGKIYRRRSSLRAHDEKNEARQGDKVEIVACRRLSKTKCWRLARIITLGPVV